MSYTLTCRFQDATDGVILQLIGEQGDQVVGINAADFRNLKEVQMASPDQQRDIMSQSNYNNVTVVVRAKVDDYMSQNGGGDEVRFRFQAVRVYPHNIKEENEMLLNRLSMYAQKQRYQ